MIQQKNKSDVYAYLEYFTSCDDLKLIFQFVQESRTEQIGRHFHYVNLKKRSKSSSFD